MKRGEIRWYEFQPPDKRRPVLILTRDSVIGYLNEVTVAPITTTIRGIPSEVRLSEEDGLSQASAVHFDHLQTVPKSKIGRLIATRSPTKLEEAAPARCFALGFDYLLP
jgi:mRNA interferase MazF